MPWPIHTVVFDLDDTLFAEADFVLSGFRAAGNWLKSQRGIDGFTEASVQLFHQGVRGSTFDDALRALGVAPEVDLVQQLVRAYREHLPLLSVPPDVARFFASQPRFKLALLSDGYLEVQQRKFAALQLAPLFSCVVFTDAFGRAAWKPNPQGFRHIQATLGGPAAGFVYVADNPRKDFIAPRGLGWRTIRIRRSQGEHARYEPSLGEAAEQEIVSLDELHALIAYSAFHATGAP